MDKDHYCKMIDCALDPWQRLSMCHVIKALVMEDKVSLDEIRADTFRLNVRAESYKAQIMSATTDEECQKILGSVTRK